MRALGKVNTEWNSNFTYALGLIATDGNISTDGRHVNFTSKDLSLAKLYKKCLNIDNKIGKKARSSEEIKKYYVVQFGDIRFCEFLQKIGITKRKSKTISEVTIPDIYFADFFRGCIDGDGSISVFSHPESKQPQLKLRLYSASLAFLQYIKNRINVLLKTDGGWISEYKRVKGLSWGKRDSVKIIKFMYYNSRCARLERKYKIAKAWASGEIGYTRMS